MKNTKNKPAEKTAVLPKIKLVVSVIGLVASLYMLFITAFALHNMRSPKYDDGLARACDRFEQTSDERSACLNWSVSVSRMEDSVMLGQAMISAGFSIVFVLALLSSLEKIKSRN